MTKFVMAFGLIYQRLYSLFLFYGCRFLEGNFGYF